MLPISCRFQVVENEFEDDAAAAKVRATCAALFPLAKAFAPETEEGTA